MIDIIENYRKQHNMKKYNKMQTLNISRAKKKKNLLKL